MTVTVEMMRDGPEETQVVSAVETIEVGQDQNGKTLTSLVIVPSEAEPPGSTKDGRGALRISCRAEGGTCRTWGGFSPSLASCPFGLSISGWLADRFYKTYAEAEEDEKKRQAKIQKAFVRALGDAQSRGLIGCDAQMRVRRWCGCQSEVRTSGYLLQPDINRTTFSRTFPDIPI